MQKIRSRILKMRAGAEKKFLQDFVVKLTEAIRNNDIQKMDLLNERLNDLCDGLSEEGQKIAQEIAKKIMEVRNE